MSDHAQAGQKMRISASSFNTMMDVTRAVKEGRHDPTKTPKKSARDHNIVLVKNNTGSAIDRFSVLGNDGVLYTPTDNLDGFKNSPIFKGIAPVEDTHEGNFFITLEPIPSEKLGHAISVGVTAVQINVTDVDHTSADIAGGQTGYLESSDNGAAQILWKETGEGTKWALVRLPMGGSALPPPTTRGMGLFVTLSDPEDPESALVWAEDWGRFVPVPEEE